jgi:hypothetical protein
MFSARCHELFWFYLLPLIVTYFLSQMPLVALQGIGGSKTGYFVSKIITIDQNFKYVKLCICEPKSMENL